MKERLHKVLAAGGFGSRRQCEQMIRLGEVQVDGRTVTEVGTKVDPEKQKIKCSGRFLRPARRVTYMLNKPRGYICSARDEKGRRTVLQLLPVKDRLFTVGRLDAESQGLLLLTNDGDLCNLLTHPRYQVPRTYHVIVRGVVTPELLARMRRGVWLAERKTGPVLSRVKHRERDQTVLEVTVHEGMNREVRRIFARYGLKVKRLKRIRLGSLQLGPLSEGQSRPLTNEEVERLKRSAEAAIPKAKETAHAAEEE